MGKDQVFLEKFCALPQRLEGHALSWRMSGTLFEEVPGFGLHPSCMDWPKSGMMRNGMFYRLPTLVPSIGGREYGLLPTPLASDNVPRGDLCSAANIIRLQIGKQVGLAARFKGGKAYPICVEIMMG